MIICMYGWFSAILVTDIPVSFEKDQTLTKAVICSAVEQA
jgi:hypothetical protein